MSPDRLIGALCQPGFHAPRWQREHFFGLEASGHYWMSLWRLLLERDWAVQVFNPVLSSKSARTHLRGRKTDADEALFIARTVRDGDFLPLQPAQEDTEQLKLLCRQRRFITHKLANAKRRLTGLIDLSFPEFSRHFEDIHSKAAHAVLKAAPQCRRNRRAPKLFEAGFPTLFEVRVELCPASLL